MNSAADDVDSRVLLLTPTRRDAETSCAVLARAGVSASVCDGLHALCAEIERGAGAALITQEALLTPDSVCLANLLSRQPQWSDFPVIVLTPAGCDPTPALIEFAKVYNAPLLPRPLQLTTLISTVQAALRDRRRQYAVRDLLAQQLRDTAALEMSDRRKDDFLAVLAHELRNPLAPVRTGIDYLLLTSPGDEDVLAMMSRQIQHMVRLIDDLLDVSRINRGKLILQKETCELADVVRAAVEATRGQIEEAGLQLHITLPAHPIALLCDSVRLCQVFSNLLNNSAKYTERSGRIDFIAEVDNGRVIVRIRDTGIGIPPEMLSRVFEMFTQVSSAVGRARGGLGIGLTLVKSVVEMHDGTISVASAGAGRGTEFTVTLPVTETVTMKRSGLPHAALRVPALDIVIADDNTDAAFSLRRLLEQMGHRTEVVHDGPDAVQIICSRVPDIAIVDIGMPTMSGYEVAMAVRSRIEKRRVPFLAALTGWGQTEDRRKAFEAGFDAHLVKPAEVSALTSVLNEAAARRLSSN